MPNQYFDSLSFDDGKYGSNPPGGDFGVRGSSDQGSSTNEPKGKVTLVCQREINSK